MFQRLEAGVRNKELQMILVIKKNWGKKSRKPSNTGKLELVRQKFCYTEEQYEEKTVPRRFAHEPNSVHRGF